jgi:serine/threonine-protein kinase
MAFSRRLVTRREKPDIERLCAKAIELDETRRYSPVEAFSRDIDRYLSNQPLEARPWSLSYRMKKFVARNRRTVAISTCGSAILLYLLVAFSLRLASERNATLEEAKRTKAVEQFLLGLLEGGDKTAGPLKQLFSMRFISASSWLTIARWQQRLQL